MEDNWVASQGRIAPLQEVIGYACKPTKRVLSLWTLRLRHRIDNRHGGGWSPDRSVHHRWTPAGCPIAPVIKVTGNPATYRNMEENIDVNAGRVLEDGATIQRSTRDLDLIVRVCNRER